MIAFLCTSVLLLESFREPGTSASPPINRKFTEDCLGFVGAASKERFGSWPNSTIRSSPAVRSTRLDTFKRMSSLWSCCCREVCALHLRIQSPRHSFLGTLLCESALSELTRIVEHGLLDMDGVHIGANLGLRVVYRCLQSPASRGAHGSLQRDSKKLRSSRLSSFNTIAQ